MSDLYLFLIGTIVTLTVGSAVGLLFYGAAKEPREAPLRFDVERIGRSSPSHARRGPSARSRRSMRSWTRSF